MAFYCSNSSMNEVLMIRTVMITEPRFNLCTWVREVCYIINFSALPYLAVPEQNLQTLILSPVHLALILARYAFLVCPLFRTGPQPSRRRPIPQCCGSPRTSLGPRRDSGRSGVSSACNTVAPIRPSLHLQEQCSFQTSERTRRRCTSDRLTVMRLWSPPVRYNVQRRVIR